MSWFMVDIEADGPCPGLYSMVSFGAVIVRGDLSETFYGRVRPITDNYQPDTLAISRHTREEHLTFEDPKEEMKRFAEWIAQKSKNRAMMVSDNPAWDYQWISYYFWNFYGANPFGHTATNLGSLYKGLVKDTRKNFKHLRAPYPHTHNPVDDSKGNAWSLVQMRDMGLNITLE